MAETYLNYLLVGVFLFFVGVLTLAAMFVMLPFDPTVLRKVRGPILVALLEED